MFNQSPDDRLSVWSEFRKSLENSSDPLREVLFFWKDAPFVPLNTSVDPYFRASWPTPWEIIIQNKYDDFTKALMIAWTLKLTDRFKRSKIEIKTIVDLKRNYYFNLVFVDEMLVLNYKDDNVVEARDLPDSFRYENLIEVEAPR
jgi:hypothetical protein